MSAPRTPCSAPGPRQSLRGGDTGPGLALPPGLHRGPSLIPRSLLRGDLASALQLPKQAALLGIAGSGSGVPRIPRAPGPPRALHPLARLWAGHRSSPLSSFCRDGQLQYNPGPPASAFDWKLAWVCLLARRKEGGWDLKGQT